MAWRIVHLMRWRFRTLAKGRTRRGWHAAHQRNEGAAMSTTSQNGLTGQRALVTGATSDIGRAVALQLARDGAEVLVHGRDAARGAETVEEITAAGGEASFVASDLGDAVDVQRLGSEVGDIDILVNNAGVALFGPTGE